MERRSFFGAAALAVLPPWTGKSRPSFVARNLASGMAQNRGPSWTHDQVVRRYQRLILDLKVVGNIRGRGLDADLDIR